MEIQNLSRMDDGLYRCAFVVKGRSMTADFMLKISRKPSFSNDQRRFSNDQRRFRFLSEVGKITHLSLHGDSYPSPTISWMSSSGVKLGIWTVEYTSGQFTVLSTIFPTLKSHINEYKALVRNSEGSVEIIIILNVYGRPIISKTEMTIERQTWILSVFFFTSSLPFEVKWYINDTHIQQNNSSTIKIANVSLICYEKNISTAGYRSDFLLTNSNGRHLKMNCHIKNKYDSVEGSFENIWSPMGNLIGSTDMDFTETIVSTVSIDRQPKGNYITVKDLYIYISIISATSLIIALSVAMIMIRIRLRRKGKLDMNVNAEREHARENNPPLEIQNESQYEEIDDRSYNSVTCQNYDLNATSSLDESTDASDRNSHIEIYNSIPNVYVDLENSQTESHHYQSTTVNEIPTNIRSGNSPVKFEVIK